MPQGELPIGVGGGIREMKHSYYLYGNINPCRILKAADKLLNEYCDIAESLKIDTFLCFGTCLGFIRDGGYIVNDNDIDVGIMMGIKDLMAELIKNGFVIKRRGRWRWHFLKYGILLDVYSNAPRSVRKYFQSFDKVVYEGRAYNVPHPVEEYLKAIYGDWKTKKYRGL